MRQGILFCVAALSLGFLAVPAVADTVTYSITVNTTSQLGNDGFIDLELNAGTLPSADITATVSMFAGPVLNASDPDNNAINVIGFLPGELSFDNQSGNDYFEGLTFGEDVSFLVTLSGAGISSTGSGASTSGTVFQLSFLDPSMTTPLFTTDPSGTQCQ